MKTIKTTTQLLIGLTLAVVLVACGKQQPPPGDKVIIPQTTKVAEPSTRAALTHFDRDSGVMRFSANTPFLQNLRPDDVLVSEPSAAAPYGYLRKVKAIRQEGGEVVLETRPARMEEAFQELELRLKTTVVAPARAQQQGGLSFPLNLSGSGPDGRVDLRGSLSLAPSFDLTLDLDIVAFKLSELSLSFRAKETFLATLTGRGRVSFDESVTLGTISFAPIVLTLPSPSGAVPVVLTPQVVIEAGLQGTVKGDFSASVNQEAGFTAGLGYKNGTFGGFSDSDSAFAFEQPVYAAAASVKALAGPRLEVLLYGAVGPFASAEAYVELSASAEGPPPCVRGVMNAGLSAKAGVDFLADYETVLLNETFPLASFDSCNPDPGALRPAITWSRSFSRTGSMGERARGVIEASDGSYLVVGDSSLFDGVTGHGASLWAMRLDALGNVIWQKAFGQQTGFAKAVQEVPGGFVVASAQGLMKLDTGGNLLWAKRYAGAELVSMVAYADGSLLVAGHYGTTPHAWAMRLDAQGEVLWSRRFGEGTGSFNRVRLTSDGGAILVGWTAANAGDVYLVKVDASGNARWQRHLNNRWDRSGGKVENPTILDGTDTGFDVAERSGGGYVVVAETYGAFPVPEPGQGGHYASWVIELGNNGDILASTVYRVPAGADYSSAYALIMRPNGTTVIVGRRADRSSDLLKNEDILIIQGGAFSALGGRGNDSVYGGVLGGGSGSMPIGLSQDGGLILAATSTSFAGKEQIWVVKLNRTANINFPYLTNLSGAFYRNEHSVSQAGTANVTGAQLVPETVTAAITSEVTGVESQWQVP
jgi:hypothetical protein